MWVYPLPIGRVSYTEGKANAEEFMQEIRRVVNTHSMQNPARQPAKPLGKIYIGGTEFSERFISVLREAFQGVEVQFLEPFRRMSSPGRVEPPHAQVMGVALGVGITFLEVNHALSVNLIGEKVKTERIALRLNLAEHAARYAAIAALVVLIAFNIERVVRLVQQSAAMRTSRNEIASYLPTIKALQQEKQDLTGAFSFLERRLINQSLQLQSLAAVSAGKSPFIEISEFESKEAAAAAGLEVYVSGMSFDYNEINEFLVKLKKQNGIDNVKIISSSFPEEEEGTKAIQFKLRFDIQ